MYDILNHLFGKDKKGKGNHSKYYSKILSRRKKRKRMAKESRRINKG